MVVNTLFPPDQNASDVKRFGHMKQECPTYLKIVRKNKALIATLSDTELDTESDNSDDEGILNAFTTTVNPTEEIVKRGR